MGINVEMRSPSGQPFELQFHTPDSYNIKSYTHDLYDIIRDPTQPLRLRQMAFGYCLQAYRNVVIPDNLANLGRFGRFAPFMKGPTP